MKVLVCAVALIATLTTAAVGAGADAPPAENRLKIGLLDLELKGLPEKELSAVMEDLEDAVSGVGFYSLHRQASMEKAFSDVGKKFPRFCRDPRSVIAVGNVLKLDRMLYGSLEQSGKSFGCILNLVDVQTRQTIEKVTIQSDPGVAAKDLLHAAVLRLHGQAEEDLDIKLHKYFGPEVHNEKEILWSTVATLGVGMIWALGNGSFSPVEGKLEVDERMSGIPTRSYHIPLHARPAALAHAYTGASDDAYGVLYNPAGMAWVSGSEAVVAYQYRFGMDNFAASYVNKGTRDLGFGHAFLYNGDREHLSSEVTFVSAFGYKFNQLLSFLPPFSVGASVKLINVRSDGNGSDTLYFPSNQSERSFGLGLDLGLRVELSDRIMYGIAFKDCPSFVSVHNTTGGYSYTEMNPTVLRMGGTFKAGYTTMLFADGQIPLYADQTWRMAGGIEQEMFRFIKARIGIQREIGAGYETPWVFTGGVGIRALTETLIGRYVSFDASYEYNQLESFSNVLNFSFLFGF